MRTGFSKVGLCVGAVYTIVAVRLLMQGLQGGTFSGVDLLTAAFPWSYIAALVVPRGDQMSPVFIEAGVVLNVVLFYLWGSAWESWWRRRDRAGRDQ